VQRIPGLIAIEYEKEGDVNEDIKTDVEIAKSFV